MSDHNQEEKELEYKLAELLNEGELDEAQRQEEGRKRLSPKYEVRIQTTMDPIVEETLKYRSMAKEMDTRYDKYLEQARKAQDGKPKEE